MTLHLLTAENLTHCDAVEHGFFTRKGGVSEGIYAGLNLGRGSQDEPRNVAENRSRVRQAMQADALCTLNQTHSVDVVEVTLPWTPEERPQADAMVTNRPGIGLGILTADCVPLLLADAKAKVIGAAHAGWKGAKNGIVQNTVAAMQKLGAEPSQILAAIGPAIAQDSYQVDTLFHANFVSSDSEAAPFFSRDTSSAMHYFFDLKSFVRLQCQRAGVSNIETLPQDTYLEEDKFFSYRRACHRKEGDYGRHISVVMLK